MLFGIASVIGALATLATAVGGWKWFQKRQAARGTPEVVKPCPPPIKAPDPKPPTKAP